MQFKIEIEREDDGRWIAEVPDMPAVMVYGDDRASAVAKVQALALRVSPNASNMAKRFRSWSASHSSLHEHLAEHESSTCS